jgi:hypothetical protein
MLVFVDGVLRLHHAERECREFKGGLVSIMTIVFSARQYKYIAQVVELVFFTTNKT